MRKRKNTKSTKPVLAVAQPIPAPKGSRALLRLGVAITRVKALMQNYERSADADEQSNDLEQIAARIEANPSPDQATPYLNHAAMLLGSGNVTVQRAMELAEDLGLPTMN